MKKTVLKSFTIFTVYFSLLKRDSNKGDIFCDIFKNTYLEEHLRTAASSRE